jgi:hypothetical protein
MYDLNSFLNLNVICNSNSKMNTELAKISTHSSNSVTPSQNLDRHSQRLSFLDNGVNSEFSLMNLDGRNSLIETIEDYQAGKKVGEFSLKENYEHEINSLKLANRIKQAQKDQLNSKISFINDERIYVGKVSKARLNIKTPSEMKDPVNDTTNFFTKKNILKTDYIPDEEIENHDFLFTRLRSIEVFLEQMSDIIKQETNTGSHLKSMQIALIDDIVG